MKYKPNKSNLGQWILIGLLVLIVAGGLYYWFVLKDELESTKPEEDKIEQVVPQITKPPLDDAVRNPVKKNVEQNVQVIHDTIYMYEDENGILNAEEMSKLISQGAVTVDTIYITQVDTVYQSE